jgi:cytochrome c peroxidase
MSAFRPLLLVGALACTPFAHALSIDVGHLTPEQQLGARLFFDTTLSHPAGQSCGSCHAPAAAFSDPDKRAPTSKGVNPALFGSRNAPTGSYAAFSPKFHYDQEEGVWIGGQFLDGRAATLEDQAKGPFVNPLEMANPDQASVVEKLRHGDNADLFRQVYGARSLDNVDTAFNLLAHAIAAFERSEVLSPFTSKYDAYLDGRTSLTAQELNGLRLFEDPMKGNCAACHPSQPSPSGARPLFTDFTYDNLGVPKNPHNPFYSMAGAYNPAGRNFIDRGLGNTTADPGDDGKFKVPTLRNLALTGPFMHNGYFETLEGVVDFYNTRDLKRPCIDPWTAEADALRLECWPAAELAANVNVDELGNLGLSRSEVLDIVAFMHTLTDGFRVPEPGTLALLAAGLVALGGHHRRASPRGAYRRRRRGEPAGRSLPRSSSSVLQLFLRDGVALGRLRP